MVEVIEDLSSSAVQSSLSDPIKGLIDQSKELFDNILSNGAIKVGDNTNKRFISIAPGRVNLIGEHTDYTGGYVLPFAIDYSTVVYGTGCLTKKNEKDEERSTIVSLRFQSLQNDGDSGKKSEHKIVEYVMDASNTSPSSISTKNEYTESAKKNQSWIWYVIGTVVQYLPDLPQSTHELHLSFSIAGNVPLGSGLSSSASLEVAVARFVECVIGEKYSFSSSTDNNDSAVTNPFCYSKLRALRCQKAENEWCYSPCGIMDQFISSNGIQNSLLLIDCRSYEFQHIPFSSNNESSQEHDKDQVALVIANSRVQHSIGAGEYPKRVEQCKEATEILQKHNKEIKMLRDATIADLRQCTEKKYFDDDIIYKRAHHVITENDRVLQVKDLLTKDRNDGDDTISCWKRIGQLMNESHNSMRDDYETSCHEIDILVNLALSYNDEINDEKGKNKIAVYGSRLTGGGFGGCTVSLVAKNHVTQFIEYLSREYKEKMDGTKDCQPFQINAPQSGVRAYYSSIISE